MAPVQEILPRAALRSLQFHPQSPSIVAGGCSDGVISLWDHNVGPHPTLSSTVDVGHVDAVTGTAVVAASWLVWLTIDMPCAIKVCC